jgi:hypothetical protein
MTSNTDQPETTITDRLEDRNATLDTTALVQNLDRDGFDFEPYVLPDTGDGGKTILDTFRMYRSELDGDQLDELERLVAEERQQRDGDTASEEVTA